MLKKKKNKKFLKIKKINTSSEKALNKRRWVCRISRRRCYKKKSIFLKLLSNKRSLVRFKNSVNILPFFYYWENILEKFLNDFKIYKNKDLKKIIY